MNLLPLIEAKRDGNKIPLDQIKSFADAVAQQTCQPEQVGALLMAIYLRGMEKDETKQLTLAMRDSGEVLTFPDDDRPLVDKHSTGGVGDKVSLILAPLLAALDLRVPMISGRGLGITGGTLDKMESIPGCRTKLTPQEIVDQVQNVGCVICGQTEKMIPTDQILYAMRDVTGTIPSIPLITASILSKKLAENIDSLLLDVKFGRAAFMKSSQNAHELAFAMTHLGRECGINIRAMITDMDTPLGTAAGNWIEVKEVIQCLDGQAPNDLEQLVVESAAHLLEMSGKSPSHEKARAEVLSCMNTSLPRRKFSEMIAAQGADLDAFEQKLKRDSSAVVVRELNATRSGYVGRCDARIVGEIVHELGGGRNARTDAIQPDVGIDRMMKPGYAVGTGLVLARVHAENEASAEVAIEKLETAFTIQAEPPDLPPLIAETVR